MVHRIFLFSSWFFAGCCIAFLHLAVRTTPFVWIQSIHMLIAWWGPLLVLRQNPYLVLFALPSAIIVDLFAATPFGLFTITFICSCCLLAVLLQKFFTSVSVVTVSIGIFISCLGARLLLWFLLFLLSFVHISTLTWSIDMLFFLVREAIATVIVAGCVFLGYRSLWGSRPSSHTRIISL